MDLTMLKKGIINFLKDEEGASGIEYALVAAMVAVALVLFVPGINSAIQDIFQGIQTALTGD